MPNWNSTGFNEFMFFTSPNHSSFKSSRCPVRIFDTLVKSLPVPPQLPKFGLLRHIYYLHKIYTKNMFWVGFLSLYARNNNEWSYILCYFMFLVFRHANTSGLKKSLHILRFRKDKVVPCKISQCWNYLKSFKSWSIHYVSSKIIVIH